MATVRGTYDLNARPATLELERLHREAERVEFQLRRTGDAADEVITRKNVEDLRNYQRQLTSYGRTNLRVQRSVRDESGRTRKGIERDVAAQASAITALEGRLDSLSRKRATPEIDTDGVARALAEVELLEARLKALGASKTTPRVNIPAPNMRGSGAGFGAGARGIGFGARFTSPLMLGIGATALAATPPLVGSAGALAGSFGQGILGAGAIGAAGAGVGAVGGGALVAGVASAVPGIKAASDALADYRKEVMLSGVDSKASRLELRTYRAALREAPGGTRQFLRQRSMLSDEWRDAMRPSGRNVTGMATRGVRLGRELTPLIGRSSDRITGAARGSTDDFADFLSNPASKTFYRQMTNEAEAALPVMERTTENIVGSFMNISRAATPFFREGIDFVEHWTQGWQDGTSDIEESRETMNKWVDELKTWLRLLGAGTELVADLGNAGAQPGGNMIEDLTKQLREWDRWVEKNPREVRGFFTDAVDSTEKMASALSKIVKMLWEIGEALGPLLTQFSQLVTFAGNAGLLSPGGLPLLLAGGAGVKRGVGVARGRILGGPGVPPAAGGGGGGMGGLTTAAILGAGAAPAIGGTTYGAARGLGMGRGAALSEQLAALGLKGTSVTGAGAGAAAPGGAFLRGAGARFLPIAALMAGLSAVSFPGSAQERAQAGIGAIIPGLPQPKTGDQKVDDAMGWYQENLQTKVPGGLRGIKDLRRIARVKRDGTDAIYKEDPYGSTDPERIELNDDARAALAANARSEIRNRQTSAATGLFEDIQGAAQIRVKDGQDPTASAKQAMAQITSEAKRMRGQTGKEFSQMGLEWAKSMARSNPKLKAQFNEMAENIERRQRALGNNVRVIQGKIVDVSAKSWKQVAKDITSYTEQAKQAGQKNLTALQAQALEILRQMGYNPEQIANIKKDLMAGGQTERVAMRDMTQGSTGAGMRPSVNDANFQRGHASGGRIGMPRNGSLQDQVPIGDDIAAGNELVVNRHSERRVNRILGMAGTTLGHEVSREQRGHYKPLRPEQNAATGMRMNPFGQRHATGGILRAGRMAERMGLSVGEGPGYGGVPSSGHTGGSLHYSGLAYDVSGSPEAMRSYFLKAWQSFHGSINELFYDPMGYYYDNGQKVSGAIGGHSDHVHIGFNPGGAIGRIRGGKMIGVGGGGGGPQPIHLKAPKNGLGGIPGAAADRASEMMAAGMEAKINKIIGATGGGKGGKFTGKGMAQFSAINRIFAEHNSANGDWGGERLPINQIAALAEAAGRQKGIDIPGMTMAQMTIGESNRRPGATGVDPGGTKGLGLWMITTGFNDETIARYGGQDSMRNPVKNALAMADIYKSSGQGAWYGDGSVTDRNAHYGHATGGRVGKGTPFGGWFGDGLDGAIFNQPTLIGVGDRGKEEVSIKPLRRHSRIGDRGSNVGSPRSINVHVNMKGAIINGKGDAKGYGEEIGRRAAAKITKALAESSSVAESELV